MSKGKDKRKQPIPTCMVCHKPLKPDERPNDPRDPGLCAEHAQQYQTR